jgi:hypothetical protein
MRGYNGVNVKQVYSEQEASEILKRAASMMEKATGEGDAYTPGITREELERIAHEVGVDPKFLQLAIAEQGQPESKKGPFNLTEEFERVIEGELDPSDFDVLAEHIKLLGNAGQPAIAQVGRSLQASAWTGVSQAKVNVSARNGRTRLQVKSTPLFAILMGGYPALMGAIISAASLGERGHVGLAIAAAVGFVGAGITAFNFLLRKGHEKARQLTESLKLRIADETESKRVTQHSDEISTGEPLSHRLGQSD